MRALRSARSVPASSSHIAASTCATSATTTPWHGLRRKAVDTLQAETLVLTLVRRSLGERTSHAAGASAGRQKLVDRAKLALSTDLGRRWTVAAIAREVGVSPVYLTQAEFQRSARLR